MKKNFFFSILVCSQLFSNVENDIVKKVNSLLGHSNPTDTGSSSFYILEGGKYDFKAGFETVLIASDDYSETIEKSKAMIPVEEHVYLKSSQTFSNLHADHLIYAINSYKHEVPYPKSVAFTKNFKNDLGLELYFNEKYKPKLVKNGFKVFQSEYGVTLSYALINSLGEIYNQFYPDSVERSFTVFGKNFEYYRFQSKKQNSDGGLISYKSKTKSGIFESNYKYSANEEIETTPGITKIKYNFQNQGDEYFFIKEILDEIYDNPDMKIFFGESISKGFISIISCKPEAKRFFNN
jgi:hypothetical protein